MPKISKFFVQFSSDKNKKIEFKNIDDSTTIAELKKMIVDKEGTGLGQISGLIYNAKKLQDDKTLAYYKVKRLRTIFTTFRLRGGSSYVKSLKTNELKNLGIECSSTICLLYGIYETCKSQNTQRMRFPCCRNSNICWYCYTCIQATVKRSIQNKKSQIECPNKCGDFNFDDVLFAGHFDENEEINILQKVDMNHLEKEKVKECPKCHIYMTKPNSVPGNRVRCPNTRCEYSKKDYCFICCKLWNTDGNKKCGRPECEDDFYTYVFCRIKECGTKDFTWNEKVGTIKDIPLCRLCPSCNTLIEWADKCKHLTCNNCEHGYCHSCLKRWNSCKCRYCRNNSNLPTCNLNIKCKVAPRQELPDNL